MIRLALLILALLPLSNQTIAGDVDAIRHMQSIAGTKNHDLHSEKTGYDYHILVRLPDNYDESKSRRYPVIYLLDGGATFPMLAGYYNYLRFEEVVPEMIIVGISYGTDDWRQGNHRGTDYTAPTDQREHWGGAASFQEALELEILPLVEGTYSADVEKRVIFGQSLGGQFVLYTALTRPDLFWGHIASNPALHRNLDLFLEAHTSESSTRSMLFVARGSDDEAVYRRPGQAWMKHWDVSSVRPWTLKTTVIDGYGHFSLAPESFRQGLVWFFD
jgi:predicted alpha/beta superfamily hydrolase